MSKLEEAAEVYRQSIQAHKEAKVENDKAREEYHQSQQKLSQASDARYAASQALDKAAQEKVDTPSEAAKVEENQPTQTKGKKNAPST